MTLFALHAPPRPNAASHTTCAGPPDAATVFSLRPEKKPIRVPSGDQKGSETPSPLSMRRATAESSARTHNWFSPDTPVPTTNATIRPFGDNATWLESGFNSMPAGGVTDSRLVSPGMAVDDPRLDPTRVHTANARAPAIAMIATAHASRSRPDDRVADPGDAIAG